MKTLFLAMSEAGAPAIEPTIVWLVQWLKLGIETTGALLIAIGVVVAIIQLLRQFAAHDLAEFTAIRLTLRALPRSGFGISARRRHSLDRSRAELGANW